MGTIRFDQTEEDDFSATKKAEEWCKENGISIGTMQGNSPRGLMYGGDYHISKWRNLSAQDIKNLDGTMTGDPRHGPIFIEMRNLSAQDTKEVE